jgi:hypothetical protein
MANAKTVEYELLPGVKSPVVSTQPVETESRKKISFRLLH